LYAGSSYALTGVAARSAARKCAIAKKRNGFVSIVVRARQPTRRFQLAFFYEPQVRASE
jgi:hypothetical protein